MTDHIVVDLPMPLPALWPNARPSRWGKIGAVTKYRGWAKVAAQEALQKARILPPNWTRVRVDVTAYFTCNRTRDRDNIIAALKGGFDGLTLAGVWLDDSGVQLGEIVSLVDKKHPRIELKVTPIL